MQTSHGLTPEDDDILAQQVLVNSYTLFTHHKGLSYNRMMLGDAERSIASSSAMPFYFSAIFLAHYAIFYTCTSC